MSWSGNSNVKLRLRQLGMPSSGCDKTDRNSIKEAEKNIFTPETYAAKREAVFNERIKNQFIFKFDAPKEENIMESSNKDTSKVTSKESIENLPIPDFLKGFLSSAQESKPNANENKKIDFLS